MPNVIIYRHQLFKASEGFIFNQTKHLSAFQPIFAGRKIDGVPPPSVVTRTITPSNFITLAQHVLFRNNQSLYKKLMLDKPALVHAHFGVEGVYALPLSKKLGIPLITTFHGFDASYSKLALIKSRKISWLNYLAHRHQLIKRGDLFICVSDFMREKVLQLGFPEERTITHYIGIDTEQIKPISSRPARKTILHVARLVEKKGTACLLKAFSILKQKGIEADLQIIGDGPLANELHTLAKTLNIDTHVHFLGVLPPETVIHHMQQSTLFCLPSQQARTGDSEGLGMVFLEAAACAKPSVATFHGGIPEVIKNNETGLLVAENNPPVLAERLMHLLENENVCTEMGKAARQHAVQHFDLKKQTKILESFYQKLT